MSRRKIRFLVALAAASPAAAQPTVSYELSWRSIPSGNTFSLMFGESAEIILTARFTPNVGSALICSPPSGCGFNAGLFHINFDLIGCASNNGQWQLSGNGLGGTTGTTWGRRVGWDIGPVGTPQLNGDVLGCSAGQFPLPGQTANPLNPIIEIWRGKWTPSSYQPAHVHRFTVAPIESALVARYSSSGQFASIPAVSQPTSISIMIDPGGGGCVPQITQQPQLTTAFIGDRVTLTAAGSPWPGCPPLSYSWRKGCTVLTNGGSISGANSPTLVIDLATAEHAGQYEAVVGILPSAPATLTLVCYANCDMSVIAPILNVNDFVCFNGRFAAGHTGANCDRSTIPPLLNVNDFLCFVNKFATGCD